MEALSPRSANIPSKVPKDYKYSSSAKNAFVKEEAARKAQDTAKKVEEEAKRAKVAEERRATYHAPPPPDSVIQPPGTDGAPGQQYITGRCLGKGGFAICYEGKLVGRKVKGKDQIFALKIVKSIVGQKRMQEKFRTELQIHSKMRHPNIVEFHCAFTFGESTYIVLELCPYGSIMEMVKKRKCLSLPEVRRYGVQLCGAVKYMHARNVIHRDLKMGNLFLDEQMNIKIGDFGLAAILVTESEVKGASRRTTLCGTPNYIAPEILSKGHGGHDHKVDLWAVGIIIFAMLTGYPPFASACHDDIYRKVKELDYSWPTEKCANDIPAEAKSLVASLLTTQAEERPDPDYIVAHPFFSMHGGRNIPFSLSSLCTVKQPDWLLDCSPRGDVISSDARCISLLSLAKECGVGRFPEINRTFSVAGEDVGRSLYYEFLDEEAAGRTPSVPLPEDIVYTSYVSSNSIPERAYRKAEKKKQQSIASAESQTIIKASREGTVKSHASQLRMEAASNSKSSNGEPLKKLTVPKGPSYQQTVATARGLDRPRSNLGLLDELPLRPASISISESNKARTLPKDFSRVTRSTTVTAVPDEKSQPVRSATVRLLPSNERVISVGDLPVEDVNPPVRVGRRVPSARAAAKAVTVSGNPSQRSLEKASTTVGQVAQIDGVGTYRRFAKDKLLQSEENNRSTKPAEPDIPEKSETRPVKKVSERGPSGGNKPVCDVKVPEVPGVLIGSEEVVESMRGTRPDEVLQMLQTLSQNLTKELENAKKQTRDGGFPRKLNQAHPAVTRWVDYSNKFGVGYILRNGSVGCIFNGNDQRPSGGVLVPEGEDHMKKRNLARYSEKYQLVPKDGPLIEFFEYLGDSGLRRAMVHPETYHIDIGLDGIPDKLKAGLDKFDTEKRRCLVLWDKFAQYMMGKLGKSGEFADEVPQNFLDPLPPRDEAKTKKANAGPYAKFYQRIGNVGLWGFGDGAMQLNFPDHTKLVVSGDGLHADFYYLPPSATKVLKRGESLPQTELCLRKELLGLSVAHLLRGSYGSKNFQEAMERNELTDKLIFVRTVVDTWIENGGLGRMGSHKELRWEGIREAKASDKLVWVTVGARGVDGPNVTKYTNGSKRE